MTRIHGTYEGINNWDEKIIFFKSFKNDPLHNDYIYSEEPAGDINTIFTDVSQTDQFIIKFNCPSNLTNSIINYIGYSYPDWSIYVMPPIYVPPLNAIQTLVIDWTYSLNFTGVKGGPCITVSIRNDWHTSWNTFTTGYKPDRHKLYICRGINPI